MGIRSDYSTDLAWNIHRFANHSLNYGHGRADLQAEIDENSEEIKEYKKSLTVRRTEFEALDLEKVNYIKACLLVIYGLLVLWFAYIMFKNKADLSSYLACMEL